MNVEELLRQLKTEGVDLRAEKDELVVTGGGSKIEQFLPDLRLRKFELLAILGLPDQLLRDIETIASFYNFTVADICEAKLIAAGDVDGARRCFSKLVKELPRKSSSQV